MNNICQTYSASTLQQSYKIVTGTDGNLEKKKVFPVSVIQAIYDGETGKRLDAILQERGGGGGSFTTEVVVSLPSVGTNGTIYLILNKESSAEENIYDEYIWVASLGDYEKLGSLGTDIDLSNYVTKTEFKTLDTEVRGLNTDVESLEGAVQVTSTVVNLGSANKATALKGTSLTYNNKNIATTDLIPNISNKVDKESGKGLSSNDYTTAEKNKLSGIAANANNYSLPTAASSTLGGIKLGYSTTGENNNYAVQADASGNAYVNVPWYVITYPLASSKMEGLMSKEDKTKLDNLNAAGEVILTQAEYNALSTKDENTIYYIVG